MSELFVNMPPREFRRLTAHLSNTEYLSLVDEYYPWALREVRKPTGTKARHSADKRRKSLDELSGREHGWWEQGATHRTVILDLMGYVPESWEVLKERLLALPENLLVVDYMLECVNRVEDGEFDPQWVTLPALLGHSG